MTEEQRKQKENDPDARKSRGLREADIKISGILGQLAEKKNTTLQAIVCPDMCPYSACIITDAAINQALAYLFHQSTYVFPIVGVQTVEHVKAMPEALRINLSKDEIEAIQSAVPFNPLFPVNFLFNFRNDQNYNLSLTAANNQQYQMAAWINAPPKQPVSRLRLF